MRQNWIDVEKPVRQTVTNTTRPASPIQDLRRYTCVGCIHQPNGKYGNECQECIRNPINHADFYQEARP